jgi:hypothetical protein
LIQLTLYADSFDGSGSAFPFPSPPAPAPGPSLLDDNESKFLDSFFDGVSSDQFNGDFFSTAGDGMVDMGFNWQDLPPAFMGTTSSFGQQPMLSTNDLSGMSFLDMNSHMGMPSNRLPSTTSADVLEAATLLQNGHNRSQNTINGSLFATQDLSLAMTPHHNGQAAQTMMPYSQPRLRPTPPKQDDFGDTYYAELMFGPAAANGRPHPKGPPKDADIHWGSDAGFGGGQGFIAPPGQVSIEAIEQNLIHVVECVEAKGSTAASTGPNSPIAMRYIEPPRRHSEQTLNGHGHGHEENEEDSRPRKRRKNKMKEEDDDDDEDDVASKAPRKRKSKHIAPPSSSTTQSPPPSKRRKSGASSATKPARENLTEDQKRENHIKSEQKRRTLIKEGFDDLNELVPDLRGGGHSKSVVLVMAADWLEDLIEGNKVLRARLQELEEGVESNSV